MMPNAVQRAALAPRKGNTIKPKRALNSSRGENKPASVFDAQECVARLQTGHMSENLGRKIRSGANDGAVVAKKGFALDHDLERGIFRRDRASII